MEESKKAALEVEKARGEEYGRIYKTYIEPFVQQKEEQLFGAFKEVSAADQDKLLLIRLQVNALESLKDEFQHYVRTGDLASVGLKEMEKENATRD
jgi:hypothetical protein